LTSSASRIMIHLDRSRYIVTYRDVSGEDNA